MLEAEVSTAAHLLPLTAPGHTNAVFRAQTVSLFHTLSSMRQLLDAYPAAHASVTARVRDFLQSPTVTAVLDDSAVKRIRNRCIHYEIRQRDLVVDITLPMGGIIEALHPTHSGASFARFIADASIETVEVMRAWRTRE
jgi:hypothetical protein